MSWRPACASARSALGEGAGEIGAAGQGEKAVLPVSHPKRLGQRDAVGQPTSPFAGMDQAKGAAFGDHQIPKPVQRKHLRIDFGQPVGRMICTPP